MIVTLAPVPQRQVRRDLEKLATRGLSALPPLTGHIEGAVWELRSKVEGYGLSRIFYYRDGLQSFHAFYPYQKKDEWLPARVRGSLEEVRGNHGKEAMKQVVKRTSAETISEEAQLREIDERHFLAQQIFFRRGWRHWSQEELAQASGLTQAQVATLEAGQANPTLRTLAKLATALQCTVAELFADQLQSATLALSVEVHRQRNPVVDRRCSGEILRCGGTRVH